MSRYIDAEWLKKRIHDVPLANGAVHGCVDKLDLNEAPTIDIVRCKECKYFRDTRDDELERTSYSDGWCKRISRWGDVKRVRANDFCSYGEREDDECMQRI